MKTRMFYLRCCFNLPFCFWFVFVFCWSKGLKFKAHALYVGTRQPALLFQMWLKKKKKKVFLLDRKTMCAKLYVIFLLLMLWILTVHKKITKKTLFSDAFPLTLETHRNKHAKEVLLCDGFLSGDARRCCKRFSFCCCLQNCFRQFVTSFRNWPQFCSSVGLHCASLLAHSIPQPEAPSLAFTAFLTSARVNSAAAGWFLPSVY